jgi:Protein of unknown function (DUF3828)
MSLKHTWSGFAAVWVLMGLAACANDDGVARTPERAVEQFYEWRLQNPSMSVPSDEQLAQMKPFLTDELFKLLSVTATQSRKASSNATSKRSFIDGDLFSSLSSGPTSFVPVEAETLADDEHVIAVQLTSAQQLPAVHWVDRVRVVRENDRYVIADVQYANHWSMGSHQTLVGALKKHNKRRKA